MVQTVKVPLAENAIYVSGTVNGVDRIWTREEGNVWSTTADRSPDGVYRVVLSIVYGDGKTTSDSVTLYYGLILITDRTQNDVASRTKKGYYNSEDLNRVGAAMVYIRDRLKDNGYDIEIYPYTAWAMSDIPSQSSMDYYLACVRTLRGAMALPIETPEAPSTAENLTYVAANNIEKIIELVDQMLTNSIASVWYSGEVYCGEVL